VVAFPGRRAAGSLLVDGLGRPSYCIPLNCYKKSTFRVLKADLCELLSARSNTIRVCSNIAGGVLRLRRKSARKRGFFHLIAGAFFCPAMPRKRTAQTGLEDRVLDREAAGWPGLDGAERRKPRTNDVRSTNHTTPMVRALPGFRSCVAPTPATPPLRRGADLHSRAEGTLHGAFSRHGRAKEDRGRGDRLKSMSLHTARVVQRKNAREHARQESRSRQKLRLRRIRPPAMMLQSP
jgi:hypothetical protein